MGQSNINSRQFAQLDAFDTTLLRDLTAAEEELADHPHLPRSSLVHTRGFAETLLHAVAKRHDADVQMFGEDSKKYIQRLHDLGHLPHRQEQLFTAIRIACNKVHPPKPGEHKKPATYEDAAKALGWAIELAYWFLDMNQESKVVWLHPNKKRTKSNGKAGRDQQRMIAVGFTVVMCLVIVGLIVGPSVYEFFSEGAESTTAEQMFSSPRKYEIVPGLLASGVPARHVRERNKPGTVHTTVIREFEAGDIVTGVAEVVLNGEDWIRISEGGGYIKASLLRLTPPE